VTTRGDPIDPMAVAAEIDREIRALPAQGVQPVRAVRRAWSRRLRPAPAEAVVAVAMALVDRQRWVAYELLFHHPGALDHLSVEEVEQLGEGMADWGSVDAFGCTVSGPVWRRGGLPDGAVHRWTVSPDRWWRRFLDTHHEVLAARVRREVRSKLETGRKHPARRAT